MALVKISVPAPVLMKAPPVVVLSITPPKVVVVAELAVRTWLPRWTCVPLTPVRPTMVWSEPEPAMSNTPVPSRATLPLVRWPPDPSATVVPVSTCTVPVMPVLSPVRVRVLPPPTSSTLVPEPVMVEARLSLVFWVSVRVLLPRSIAPPAPCRSVTDSFWVVRVRVPEVTVKLLPAEKFEPVRVTSPPFTT